MPETPPGKSAGTPSEPELNTPTTDIEPAAATTATETPAESSVESTGGQADRKVPLWTWIVGGALLWLVSLLLTATLTSALTVHQVKQELGTGDRSSASNKTAGSPAVCPVTGQATHAAGRVEVGTDPTPVARPRVW
ncbi:MAG: hypothetical protein HZY75_00155 [Nocardioidaceae bacterium]|nr:MAG: hypothetical protein HZY75_00155 [Nocardioidaceae bacterium]